MFLMFLYVNCGKVDVFNVFSFGDVSSIPIISAINYIHLFVKCFNVSLLE